MAQVHHLDVVNAPAAVGLDCVLQLSLLLLGVGSVRGAVPALAEKEISQTSAQSSIDIVDLIGC